MAAVFIDVPDHVIAERKRLGLDVRDEVWNGEYHMVPAASNDHQRTILRLALALTPVAESAGLEVLPEPNLIPLDEPGWRDFRVPDLVVLGADADGGRGVIGAASLVVEIRSPRDESFKKLPFFQQLGIEDVLIIDRDSKSVRHWTHDGTALIEQTPDELGHHQIRCLPVQLWNEGRRLIVDAAGTKTVIGR